MQRIAKVISNSGICSRREAEKLIIAGQVTVNGQVISSPAINVGEGDKINVNGHLLEPFSTAKRRLWVYYKPRGLITTNSDPQGRPTIFQDLLKLPRVITVGRLDINSEGLLLLTNNGDLARQLELPSSKIVRVYKVRAHGNPQKLLEFFTQHKSLRIAGIIYTIKAIKILAPRFKTPSNSNSQQLRSDNSFSNNWFEVTLQEGKNREIRKIFEHFHLQVNRLIRIRYGDFALGNLKPSEYYELEYQSIKNFTELYNIN